MRSLIWIFMFGFGFSSCQSPSFHIEPQFDVVQGFAQGIAAVQQGGKWGFIDNSGAWVIEPRFVKAELLEGNVYQVIDESNQVFEIRKMPDSNEWAALRPLEKSILVETTSGRRSVFEKDAYWGIKDEKGNTLAAPQFDSIHYLGSNLFRAYALPKGYCLLSADGQQRSAYFQEIGTEIQFGRIRFRDNDRYGLMAQNGKIITPASWWRLEIVGQHIACSNGGQLQLCSDRLEKLSELLFDVVIPLDEHHWLAKITDTGRGRIFDAAGQVVKSEVELSDGKMMFGKLPVKKAATQKWGYINSKGIEMIPFTFTYVESFWPNGKAIFWGTDQNGNTKKGLIDTTGQIVQPAIFDQILWNPDGVYTVVQGNSIQLLDEKLNPLGEKTKKPMEYLGQGVYVIYEEKKSLKFQKSNWYTGDKAGFYWSRDMRILAVHSLDGQLLLDGKEAVENEPLPLVSEGLAAAKKWGKWGFVRCKSQ
ncbi:MAG: WG repeat-containing protein [Haliscomenobacter sp.]|uniref:WG repeat-containing protein n=1 Tax=Haliscomenobacter sp. TaxID=2717303 RepID=UPI0029AF7746|nr:WG repeat-containing protein [Haliscomenobacter sp.]MDX2067081.1 WG repeat-containing protein [Haliscomenobacter sp.]